MGSNADTKSYESLVKDAAGFYLDKQFRKALTLYNDALKLATNSNMNKMIICILKYMICCCLYESDELDDLAEVVMILQTMDWKAKNWFPASYCLLAQTHCKLFRFELAERELANADAIFSRNLVLETFYIPGSNTPIRPTRKDDEIWLKIRKECLANHQPDAVCSSPDCNYVTKPYVTPSKNIFFKDPAFNGMVIVNCNNKVQSCELNFHQFCWKMKKDELYPIKKVSDKDILGNTCFTPNCLTDNTPSVITSIRVIDSKGELKTHIKENLPAAWPVKPQEISDKITSEGAIRRTKVDPVPTSNDTPQKLQSLIEKEPGAIRKESVHSKDVLHYYDESQIIVVKDPVLDIDFSHEPSEIAGEKSFLVSLFHDYIKKNHVQISDVYSKFHEYNQDLHLKDLDILGFLLKTDKFEVLSEKNTAYILNAQTEEIISHPSESFRTKSFDDDADGASFIDDVYNELMNDELYMDCTQNEETIKNYHSNTQFQDSNLKMDWHDNFQKKLNTNANIKNFGHDAAGGDASGQLKDSADRFSHQSFESIPKFEAIDPIKTPSNPGKGNENERLMDYIMKLESDMEKIMDENSILRKELVNKEADIESYKKEHATYQEKIKMCEQLFETMTDFQKGYDNIKEENFKIKEELVQVMQQKCELENKVEELQDPEARRVEFMKLFQEEYVLLETALNEEWESKTDILKKSLKTEIEVKMSLLNKLLNTQYSSNMHVVAKYLERCYEFLEITTKVNEWMKKTINVQIFEEKNSEWIMRMQLLKKMASELRSEYSTLLNKLQAEKEDKFKMTDINLKIPAIPNPPEQKLSDFIIETLDVLYKHQHQIMQNYVIKAQAASQAATQAMPYQMHSASQTQNFVQARYMQQFPYATNYPIVQLSGPMTPVSSPLNFTLPPHTPVTRPIPPTRNQASTPINEIKIEESKCATAEQSVPAKVADISVDKEKIDQDAEDIKESKVIPAEKIDTFKDKIAQMREAFKNIALNVKEKSISENPVKVEIEQIITAPDQTTQIEQIEVDEFPEKFMKIDKAEIKKISDKSAEPAKFERKVEANAMKKNQSKNNVQNINFTTKSGINGETQSINGSVSTGKGRSDMNGDVEGIKDSVSLRDDGSDITTLTSRNDTTLQKKVGMDGLVKMLLKKFPGVMECDIIEAIAKIRKERNNALTGLPVSRIIEEAKPHIEESQRLHVIRSLENEESK